jgi:hypothetical protein
VSDTWYYFDSGERVGPLTLHELADDVAILSDAENVFVWHEGFADWKRAGDIPELRALLVHPRLLNTDLKTLVFPYWKITLPGILVLIGLATMVQSGIFKGKPSHATLASIANKSCLAAYANASPQEREFCSCTADKAADELLSGPRESPELMALRAAEKAVQICQKP